MIDELVFMAGVVLLQHVLWNWYGKRMVKEGYKVALSHVDGELRKQEKRFLRGEMSVPPREIVQRLTRAAQMTDKELREETKQLTAHG